jgi:hypothetical protein
MSLETMTKLASVTVGVGGQANINFTNIPQGYTDLQFILSVRSTGNYGSTDTMVDDMRLTFNGSSGANYTSIRFSGDGSSTYSTAFTSQTIMNRFYINGSGATTSTFGSTSIYVTNYASSTNKSLSADTVGENNATKAWMNMLAGLWNDPSPITSTSFSLVNGNFAEHSTATLYGIKNAQRTAGNSIKATGGDIIFDGTYVYHVFDATGAFVPTQPILADALVIAGGGGAGYYNAGGGGAGGIQYAASQSLITAGYTVTVGAGGATKSSGSAGIGATGGDSSFSSLVIAKGGGAGNGVVSGSVTGGAGGSGGGAGGADAGSAGGAAVAGTGGTFYGNAGGPTPGGGSGGGSGAAGTSKGKGGNGTTAFSSWGIATGTGQNVDGVFYYAGGGESNQTAGGGGFGGGGAWLNSGTPNTGGGAGADQGAGGGGSGLVIIRYKG